MTSFTTLYYCFIIYFFSFNVKIYIFTGGLEKEQERVQVHDDLMELDKISRLRRHGMNVGSDKTNVAKHTTNNKGHRQRRPSSAPTTGRRIINMIRSSKKSSNQSR